MSRRIGSGESLEVRHRVAVRQHRWLVKMVGRFVSAAVEEADEYEDDGRLLARMGILLFDTMRQCRLLYLAS